MVWYETVPRHSRNIAIWISHPLRNFNCSRIRDFTLYVVFKKSTVPNFVWLLLLIWFGFYCFYSQILSGVLSLMIILVVFFVFITFKYSKYIPIFIGGLIILFIYGLTAFLKPQPTKNQNIKELPIKTQEGNFYTNDFKSQNKENNKLVYISYCDFELEREWNKISTYKYYEKDKKDSSFETR